MMRPRFSSGLVVGLACGLPLGALLALFALPPRGGDPQQQAQELARIQADLTALRESAAKGSTTANRDLQEALAQLGEERERTVKQAQLFEELATQMSSGLGKIEKRLETLENRPTVEAAPRGGSDYPQEGQRYPRPWGE